MLLITFAFAGELVYRLDCFLAHVGDVLLTIRRHFGREMGLLRFTVPKGLIVAAVDMIMVVGASAAAYTLRLLNKGDFEGVVPCAN